MSCQKSLKQIGRGKKMSNIKYEEIKELLDSIRSKDLPEGHTIGYIHTDYIDLISNITSVEEMSDTIDSLMSMSVSVIVRVIEASTEEIEVSEAVSFFLDSFKGVLFDRLVDSPELFERMMNELTEATEQKKKEDKVDLSKLH